jgi:GTP cyclohydrolase I
MTIAPGNGSTRPHSDLMQDSTDALNRLPTRPDRNTQNGREPNLQPPREELEEPMIEAVRTLLLGVGEDPQREGLLKTP